MRTEYEFLSPVKIVTGVGAGKKLEPWISKYDAKKLLIITGSHVVKSDSFRGFSDALDQSKITYECYSKTVPEPPMEVVDELAEYVRKHDFDLIIAVGGGSPMDTAKAVCMLKNNEGQIKEYLFGGSRTPVYPSVPLICIPTTAGSGSEVSCASVIENTDIHVKLSCTHPNLYPEAAILDPMMQLDMPANVTAGTGMDALTHAIESYTSKNSSVMSEMYSKQAIAMIAKYLPKVMENPEDIESRMMMAQASTIAAIAMANGGLGAVHGLSQAMGGCCHTPHGVTNAILLPKVMKYNWKGAPEKFAGIAGLMGVDTQKMSVSEAAESSVEQLKQLNAAVGISDSIRSLGVTENDFSEIIKGTMDYRLLWMNPVTFTEELGYIILNESL